MNKFADNEFDINLHEKKIYSQNGEDGIIEFIFSRIGTTNKFFIEFGVGDGYQCNTRYLVQKKRWSGLMMDAGVYEKEKKNLKKIRNKAYEFFKQKILTFNPEIKKEVVTAENIQSLFKKYHIPTYFDLLSIDIDGNDYWVWKAITDYHPRVVVIEYNASYPPNQSKVVKYDPNRYWDGTNYFGASLLALVKLGTSKGYTLVGCENMGVNAFFCKNELIQEITVKNIQDLYKPPNYGKIVNGVHVGHQPSNKKMIEI